MTVGERIPGAAPRGIHDPALFVDRAELVRRVRPGTACGCGCAACGLPCSGCCAGWPAGIADPRMVPTRSTAVLFQGRGTKEGA